MDSAQIFLTFNEPIDPSRLNCSAITLHNASHTNSTYLKLITCTIHTETSIYGEEVFLQLHEEDIVILKSDLYFLTKQSNSYIELQDGAVYDTQLNPSIQIFQQSCSFQPDNTRASVSAFSIDMNIGIINITFNDVILAHSFNPTSLTLQHSQTNIPEFTFTFSTSSSTKSSNGYMIKIDISHSDLLGLKSTPILAKTNITTYLTFRATLFDDTRYVDVVPITDGNAVIVSQYTPDLTPPSLLLFDLDLNTGIITLSFSDTINIYTFYPTGITLISHSDIQLLASTYLQLTGGIYVRSINGTLIDLQLNDKDLNSLKLNTNLVVNQPTSYLYIYYDSIRDLHNNSLTAIQNTTALQVRNFVPDTTNPSLLNFSLDLNQGLILLTFNEVLNASTLVASGLTFQNTQFDMFTLTSGLSSTNDSSVLTIRIIRADIHSLNQLRSLTTSINNTFLSLTYSTVLDMNSNHINPISQLNPLKASQFLKDVIAPSLLSYSFDLNTGEMTLYFSEVVASELFIPSQVILLNTPIALTLAGLNLSAESNLTQPFTSFSTFALTSGDVTLQDDLFIHFQLSLSDLNVIKALPLLATNRENTYISFNISLVSDTFGNEIVPINRTIPIKVFEYTFDMTPPILQNFDLDLDSGLINIHFSETVNASTLIIHEVVLHNGRMLDSINLTLNSSWVLADYSPDIIVQLSQNDLDRIKSLNHLAKDENTTFLFIGQGGILDMNLNSYALVEYAIQVDNFIQDTTPPELVSFNLDMNFGYLTITFTEAVDTFSFDTMKIFIGSDIFLSTNFSLHSPTFLCNQLRVSSILPTVIQIELCLHVYYNLKFDLSLATSSYDTYIKLYLGALRDFSGNVVSEIVQRVFDFVPDITNPTLHNFILDMNLGKLYLYFSEPINSTSLNITTISLQAQNTFSEFVTLTSQSYFLSFCELPDSTKYACIIILLSYQDVNSIKNTDSLATQSLNTFIVITNYTIEDTSTNSIVPIPATNALSLNVSNYINDITRPTILSFDLNMDDGILIITFNEEVQRSTLSVVELNLQPSMFSGFGSMGVTLSHPDYVHWNCCKEIVATIMLAQSDINSLKLDDTLASQRNNTFLRYTSNLVQDHAGNLVEPPSIVEEGLVVSIFIPDTTSPELLNFFFNFNPPESIELLFSEPLRVSTFNVKSLTLLATPATTNPLLSYTLSNELSGFRPNSVSISVVLNFTDIIQIQSRPLLASNFSNTYLSSLPSLVFDMNSNLLIEISRMNPLNLAFLDYIEDVTHPSLSSYTLDLNNANLILTYSEVINVATILADQLTLQVSRGSIVDLTAYKLSGGILTTTNGRDWYIVNLLLSFTDLTNIQKLARENLVTNLLTTFLSIDSRHVRDMAGLDLIEINDDEAIIVELFIPDTTKPKLQSFDFNISAPTSTIFLHFNEVVDLTTFNVEYIEFHNSEHILSSTQSVILTAANLISSEDDTSLYFSLDSSDLNELKRLTSLANSANTTFIYLGSSTISDMYGNPVDDRNGSTTQVRNIFLDTTRPKLDSFDFDLNTGSISLTFSETVNSSSFNVTQIRLQSSLLHPFEIFSLTELTTGSLDDSHIITLNIHDDDLNRIKSLRSLATSLFTTYLSHTPFLVTDMQGLFVTQELGVLANTYIPDESPPQLMSFNFNLTSDILSLTFDEAIAYVHIMLTKFQIKSHLVGGSTVHLTHGVISPFDSTIINISLSPFDLNEIKGDLTLAVSLSSTLLELMGGAVTDTAGNPNAPILQVATSYFGDILVPSLESYVLDLNTGRLRLNFNEIVSSISTKLQFITLSDQPYSMVNYTLTGGILNTSLNDTIIEIYFTPRDLDAIKNLKSLAINNNSSFLSLLNDFIQDSNQNSINEVIFRPVDIFINDTNAPYIDKFSLDMNTGFLTLKFNETVNFSTFNVTGLTLQAVSNASPSQRYRLTSGSLLSLSDNNSLVLVITLRDLDAIKASSIAKNIQTTWLTSESYTLFDQNLQTLVPLINGFTSRQVFDFIPDTTPPNLFSFNVDLSFGSIDLSFSETIDYTTVNITSFTLQNNSMTIDQIYTLSLNSFTSTEHSPTITITLSNQDLNEIKRKTDLYTSRLNTFLSVKMDALRDRSNNELLEISSFNAIQVSQLLVDTVQPYFVGFDLDLNIGLLSLYFSETMNSSSVSFQHIYLLSRNSTDSTNYSLQSGQVLSSDAPSVLIKISERDLNAIKITADLAISNDCLNSTFISLTSNSISDMFGNLLVPVVGIQINTCTPDTNRPTLKSYILDLNLGKIVLNFSEAMNVSTIRFEAFKLYSSRLITNTTQSILLGGDDTTSNNGIQITIMISYSNLNEIKRLTNLGTSTSNIFLEIFSLPAISDMSGNSLIPIYSNETIMALNFVPDTTAPEILEYSLDMNDLTILFTFTETVNASTLNPIYLSIQHAPISNPDSFLTLSGGIVNLQDDTVIRLNLTLSDSNCIKASISLATNINDTYIVFSSLFVDDMNGNMVIAIPNEFGQQAKSYIEDTTPPVLQSFDLDLDEGQISLRFSESVNISTLDISGVALQNSHSPPNSSFSLTGN